MYQTAGKPALLISVHVQSSRNKSAMCSSGLNTACAWRIATHLVFNAKHTRTRRPPPLRLRLPAAPAAVWREQRPSKRRRFGVFCGMGQTGTPNDRTHLSHPRWTCSVECRKTQCNTYLVSTPFGTYPSEVMELRQLVPKIPKRKKRQRLRSTDSTSKLPAADKIKTHRDSLVYAPLLLQRPQRRNPDEWLHMQS